MRLRNVKNAVNIVNESRYTIDYQSLKEYRGRIKELFGNNNPICLEVGMGKGDFIIGMAEKYPNVNFIGIEKYESVLVRAVQKLEDKEMQNLKLVCMDAVFLDLVFDHEISTIFLNFSDPWPKNRHAKKRLTSENYLERYDEISVGNTHIIQKTDNIGLFAYSISSLSEYGYTIKKVSLDLANEDIETIETEYEKKFKSKGVRINYLDAVKKN
ncbi:MAG: tRNA (guanosine(46)-N7)-methyltransferase TrmB [Bacilli bacterium]|nr:tRNA (guanosine(46)-N7)-methyltransferase TrmB [Bacilli bacterium]